MKLSIVQLSFRVFFLPLLLVFLTVNLVLLRDAKADTQPIKPAPIRFLLSFDDGPSAAIWQNSTEHVLDALAHNKIQPNIKAIFFAQTRAVNGGGTETGRALLQREFADGHLLAFHSATPRHSNHRFLTPEELKLSLQRGVSDLTDITGTAPDLVRPPFWNYDARTMAAYEKHGMTMLLTDLSANDGKIWGVNFSMTKRRNMLKNLAIFKQRWRQGLVPAVDGSTPVIVTFHDVNSYTASRMEVYLEILLEVAAELEMPVASKPFYDDRDDLHRAAMERVTHVGDDKVRLPGLWNWLWQ
jgi:peptidoglycan/xylan/chitin deacetylase (PgdA/CDA1 family)